MVALIAKRKWDAGDGLAGRGASPPAAAVGGAEQPEGRSVRRTRTKDDEKGAEAVAANREGGSHPNDKPRAAKEGQDDERAMSCQRDANGAACGGRQGTKASSESAAAEESGDEIRRIAISHRQAYRMTPDHFWRLYRAVSPHMKDDDDTAVDDSKIGREHRSRAFRLSVALRHYAGGNSASDHGIAECEVDDCALEVADAVNECRDFDTLR